MMTRAMGRLLPIAVCPKAAYMPLFEFRPNDIGLAAH